MPGAELSAVPEYIFLKGILRAEMCTGIPENEEDMKK